MSKRNSWRYKAPPKDFGRLASQDGVNDRRAQYQKGRKEKKHDVLFGNRRISIAEPDTPEAIVVVKAKPDKKITRNEKLLAWKKMRAEKKEEEKIKKRPLFIISTAQSIPTLENIPVIKKSFAPNRHKFKPPTKIKSIVSIKDKKEATKYLGPVTRSKANATISIEKNADAKSPVTKSSRKRQIIRQMNFDFGVVNEEKTSTKTR